MGDDQLDEIRLRLEMLEGRRGQNVPDRGPGPPPPPNEGRAPGPPGLGVGFDEKRVVDLIVGLVVEQVDHLLAARLDETRLDEARLVDHVAAEVMKRLQEGMERQAQALSDARQNDGSKKKGKKKDKKKGKKG